MHVSKMIESDRRATMWEVRDGKRWWTVALLHKSGEWVVTADNGREIKAGGRTGMNLIAAIRSQLANEEKMRQVRRVLG